jgi:hypothetical protein
VAGTESAGAALAGVEHLPRMTRDLKPRARARRRSGRDRHGAADELVGGRHYNWNRRFHVLIVRPENALPQ